MKKKEKEDIVFGIINHVNYLTFEHEFDEKVLLRILSYIPLNLFSKYPELDILFEKLGKKNE